MTMTIAGCGGGTPDPANKAAAEWAIGMGGAITYGGRQKETSRIDDLPNGPFVLDKIILNKTAVQNDDLKKIAELTDLTHLELHETNITDEGLDHVAKIRSLTQLELSYTKVSDEGLQKLKQLPNLKKLYLTGTDVTDEAIKEFQKERTGCQVVRIP